MFKNPITAPTLLSVAITAILYFGGIDIWWVAATITVVLLLVRFIVGEMQDSPADPDPILISDGPKQVRDARTERLLREWNEQ